MWESIDDRLAAVNSKYLLVATLDYHNPDDSPVGEGFDAAALADQLALGGIEAVYSFARCHYGNSYYPTRIGRPHPLLKRDLFGEVITECHRVGIAVVGYVTGFIDRYAALTHPDWRHVDSDGKPRSVSNFESVCPFGPYVQELLQPQLVELTEEYPVDLLNVDTMSSYAPCYCPHCEERFRRETGLALPRTADDPGWDVFGLLRQQWADEVHRSVANAVHQVRSDVQIGFNWIYTTYYPTEPVSEIDYLTADIDQMSYQILSLGYQARYLTTLGKPFEVMTGRLLHGLGDWTIRSADALKQVAAMTAAFGGRLSIIDRRFPDGSLDPATYKTTAKVAEFLHDRERPLTGTEPAEGGTVILHGADAMFGPNWPDYGLPHLQADQQKPATGAHRALADWGEEVVIAGQHNLPAFLTNAAAVVLPEQRHIFPSLVSHIRRFLQDGGMVIASHPLGLATDEMKELFGVALKGDERHDYGYLDCEGSDEPLLIHGHWGSYNLEGAEAAGSFRRPVGEPGARYGHGMAPHRRDEVAGPGLTIHRHGEGAAVLFAGPVFTSHQAFHNPSIPAILRGLLREYAKTLVELEAPPQVQMIVRRKKDRLLVHLINAGGERLIEGWPTLDDIRPVTDLKLKLRCPKPKQILAQPGDEQLKFTWQDGRTIVRLPKLEIHRCLEIIPED